MEDTKTYMELDLTNKEESDISYDSFFFSGGEPHIRLHDMMVGDSHHSTLCIRIKTRIKSFNDLGVLMVAVDAIKRNALLWNTTIELILDLKYFPAGRQDRVCNEGESLAVKVYADLINSLGFKKVHIFDPHSDVTGALVDNVQIRNNYDLVRLSLRDIFGSELPRSENKFNLISVDAGASKKIDSLATYLYCIYYQNIDVVQCHKNRNIATGAIESVQVFSEDLQGLPCVIVDDIADGGASFIYAAKELKKKNAGDIYLIVSHGIFSKGFKELSKYFKGIYTTNSWAHDYAWETPEKEKGSEIVKIVNI